MSFPYYSALLGAFLLTLQQALMISVGFHRTIARVGIGYGDDVHLERKIRRHGNLAENASIFVLVLTLTELSGAPMKIVVSFALAFALARVCHAIGFSHLDGSHANVKGNKLFLGLRVVGATLTGWVGLGLGIYFLIRLFNL